MKASTSKYVTTFRIYLDDTDAGGIVYHANHLKLFERCRRDWLRSLGMSYYFYAHVTEYAETPVTPEHLTVMARPATVSSTLQFVVSDLTIRYYKPILLDDLVKVSIEKVTIKPASLILDQAIYRDDTLLTKASIALVCVLNKPNNTANGQPIQQTLKPTRLPKAFLDLLTHDTINVR